MRQTTFSREETFERFKGGFIEGVKAGYKAALEEVLLRLNQTHTDPDCPLSPEQKEGVRAFAYALKHSSPRMKRQNTIAANRVYGPLTEPDCYPNPKKPKLKLVKS